MEDDGFAAQLPGGLNAEGGKDGQGYAPKRRYTATRFLHPRCRERNGNWAHRARARGSTRRGRR
jgi:hypothetical protein